MTALEHGTPIDYWPHLGRISAIKKRERNSILYRIRYTVAYIELLRFSAQLLKIVPSPTQMCYSKP